MLSRLFWIAAAGIALVAGIALQDGDSIFGWGARAHDDWHREQAIEARVERTIEGSFDKMQVVDSDGRELDVPATTKRAMARAVGELLKAEAHLAMTRVGEDNEAEMRAALARRDGARAEVDRLKVEIEAFERAAQNEDGALREQIRREIREDVRATVRDAVRS